MTLGIFVTAIAGTIGGLMLIGWWWNKDKPAGKGM